MYYHSYKPNIGYNTPEEAAGAHKAYVASCIKAVIMNHIACFRSARDNDVAICGLDADIIKMYKAIQDVNIFAVIYCDTENVSALYNGRMNMVTSGEGNWMAKVVHSNCEDEEFLF